ncbi:MAG: hypothetical protein PWQ93_900 [Clostridiales bacterium]|nr:hypothetical protein [Clostridiales bacterium]
MDSRKFIIRAAVLIVLLAFVLMMPYGTRSLADDRRLYGSTREYTAVDISEDGWPDGSDYAVLVNGYTFADALAAGPLAQKLDAPILLTREDVLPEATKDEINRLGVKKVYIVGGTGVVSTGIEKQIDNMVANVTRVAGDDRFETAVEIAEQFKPADGYKGAVLATGYGFADALAGGPYAAKNGYALLLTGKDNNPIDSAVIGFIKANAGIKADTIVALGGPKVVPDKAISDAVEAAAAADELNVIDVY